MKITKRVLSAVIILTTLLLAYIFISVADHPSIGSTKTGKISNHTSSTISLSPRLLSSKYFNLSYPKILSPDKSNKADYPVLADYIFTYYSLYPWHLDITVYAISGGNVDSNADYTYRKDNPSSYQQTTKLYNSNEVYIMEDTTSPGFNKVAFIASNIYQVSISLSSTNPNTDILSEAFNNILSSFRWA